MDGNGRWAKLRSRPRTYGHLKGARVAKKIITHCSKIGIETLTMFAFSTENWLRPQAEVSFLMTLLKRYLLRETKNLVNENIRLTTIGDITRLSPELVRTIRWAEKETENNTGLHLVFAVNYGSRQEIVEATKAIVEKVLEGRLSVHEISESELAMHLSTYPASDPDLIIRTSGEYRLSNFMLWQTAYSELYFSSVLWPDFTAEELERSFRVFQQRERRFGQVSPLVETI